MSWLHWSFAVLFLSEVPTPREILGGSIVVSVVLVETVRARG